MVSRVIKIILHWLYFGNKYQAPGHGEHQSSHNYRPDIDGMRSLAIASVVAFHYFPDTFTGGYIGVDVFFVISGFLISTIIFNGYANGNFSFKTFYARRIRRIFPALTVVMFFCLSFGWLALLPEEYKMLGKHTAASAGFVENFILWGEAGYFDVASELKPLMHLWSLSIEEQFYILFPFLVFVCLRIKANIFLLINIVIVFSFACCQLYVNEGRSSLAFFMPYARFWEIIAGSILAYTCLDKSNQKKIQSINNHFKLTSYFDGRLSHRWKALDNVQSTSIKSFVSLVGLALVIAPVFLLDKDSSFPGWHALFPVVGATMLIFAGQNAFVNRIVLANRIAVGIGLISYPLYLWHWPLISFMRIVDSTLPSLFWRLVLIIISILLATSTYLFLERPIRFAKRISAYVTIVLLVAMSAAGWSGYQCFRQDGLPLRNEAFLKKSNIAIAFDSIYKNGELNCNNLFPNWNNVNDNHCNIIKDSTPNIMLIGDSHAGHLYPGIVSYFMNSTYNVGLFPASCAPPFYNTLVGARDGSDSFRAMRGSGYELENMALDYAVNNADVKVTVLAHNPYCSIGLGDIVDANNPSDTNYKNVLRNAMDFTFAKLLASGKKVIYIKDNPTLNFDIKQCIERPLRFLNNFENENCSMPRELHYADSNPIAIYNKILDEVLSKYPNVIVFDSSEVLCDDNYCKASVDGNVLYSNNSHYSFKGSEYMANFLGPIIQDVLSK